MRKTGYLLLLLVFLSAGCTQTDQYAATGAIAGGVLGGVIGHNVNRSGRSGKSDKGALVGAVIGGLAGLAIGQQKELEQAGSGDQLIVICPSCDSRVDVSGFPPHSTVQCPHCSSQFTY